MKNFEQKSTYPFLESIGAWSGSTPYLSYHQERLNRTFRTFFPEDESHDLQRILSTENIPPGKVKIRFLYSATEYKIECHSYQKKEIESLQVVEDDAIDYDFKSTDRNHLNNLYQQRERGDDILIFKDGFLTDSYAANVVCKIEDRLLTPAEPLLKGVMREYLLDQQMIDSKIIDKKKLKKADGVFLINALNPLDTAPFVPAAKIFF